MAPGHAISEAGYDYYPLGFMGIAFDHVEPLGSNSDPEPVADGRSHHHMDALPLFRQATLWKPFPEALCHPI